MLSKATQGAKALGRRMQRCQLSAPQTGSKGHSYLSCPRTSCWRLLLGRHIQKPENKGAQLTWSRKGSLLGLGAGWGQGEKQWRGKPHPPTLLF